MQLHSTYDIIAVKNKRTYKKEMINHETVHSFQIINTTAHSHIYRWCALAACNYSFVASYIYSPSDVFRTSLGGVVISQKSLVELLQVRE